MVFKELELQKFYVCTLLGFAFMGGLNGAGQTVISAVDPSLVAVNAVPKPMITNVLRSVSTPVDSFSSCSDIDLMSAPSLSFTQRSCLYRNRLFSKGFAVRATAYATFRELRKNGVSNPGFEDFTYRFGNSYARRTAQNTGEFLAGYLTHEDPRYHPSLEHGIWKRSRAALLSVVLTKNADGASRMAFTPLAGAFGSGMVGIATSRNHNTVEDGLMRSATSYTTYFGDAMMREFRPELNRIANHFLHRQ